MPGCLCRNHTDSNNNDREAVAMDKDILKQYIDACEAVKETEEQIRRLQKNRKTVVVDAVRGSMHDFPFAEKTFRTEGLSYSVVADPGQLSPGGADHGRAGKQLQHRSRARWKPGLTRFQCGCSGSSDTGFLKKCHGGRLQ